MRNLKNNKAEATASQVSTSVSTRNTEVHEDSIMYNYLIKLEKLIKYPKTRKEAYADLLAIEIDELSVSEEILYLYIRGKYWTKIWRESKVKNVEELEKADDFFSDMVQLGFDENHTIKSPRILYLKAHTKYLIGLHHKSVKIRTKYTEKTKYLVKVGLRYNPNNSSFLWLKTELLKP